MGILNKIKDVVNPPSSNDDYDDEPYVFDDGEENGGYGYGDDDGYSTQNISHNNGYSQQHSPRQPNMQQQYNQGQPMGINQNPMGGGMAINAASLELKVVRPERFDAVKQIADHLLNRRTVVLNLEATNKENARRMIDFLSGVAYSINGNFRRVANNTFVITPNNVDVSAEQQQSIMQDTQNNSGIFSDM